MTTVELHHGDCLDVMATMKAGSVDTIVTDPPYGLEFMGKDWDHGVPGVAFWEATLRVAKPGAMLLAFGGTRTHHRLMCAIEDAGWEIRDCVMWLYGSGFPKSADLSKMMDKAAGAEREVIGTKPNIHSPGAFKALDGWRRPFMDEPGAAERYCQLTAPATPEAQLWDGWGTALKPAWEPIILAMKPRDGTFAHNAIAHGVAGLWIDGARVVAGQSYIENGIRIPSQDAKTCFGQAKGQDENWHKFPGNAKGRWPANLILSHHPDCERVGVRKVRSSGGTGPTTQSIGGRGTYRGGDNRGFFNYADPDGTEQVEVWDCHPECPIFLLDGQSGQLSQCGGPKKTNHDTGMFGIGQPGKIYRESSHTASRFFQHCDWGEDDVRFWYCGKASRKERTCNGEIKNSHPTVKPLSLMKFLVRLTRTPTGGIVLDPFMGSGSTGVACVMENRSFIGIEQDAESFEITQRRIEYTQNEMYQLTLEI